MRDIIEDSISRNIEWKKEQVQKLEKLKELNFPAEVIEEQERISKMDLAEYKIYAKEQQDLRKAEIVDYAKNNPLEKNIVDLIYTKTDNLPYDRWIYNSRVHFLKNLDPLSFMSRSDFYNDLYETFIEHAYDLYQQKHKDQHND